MARAHWPCVVCSKTGADPEKAHTFTGGGPPTSFKVPPCLACDGEGTYRADDIAASLLQDIFRTKADKPVQPEAVLDLLVRTVKLIQTQGKDIGREYGHLVDRLDEHGDRLRALDGRED